MLNRMWAAAIGVAIVQGFAVPFLFAQDKKPAVEPKLVTEMITIGQGDSKTAAYLARPAKDGPMPGIVLVHEWWGLNDWVKEQANRLAGQGYCAMAVDLYRGEVAKDAEHAHELMRGLTDERAVADLKQAFGYLAAGKYTKDRPIGAIGWCMGGGFALRLAVAEPKLACCVVCYGKPVTDEAQLKQIKGPLLGIFGETDRGIDVDEFRKALKEAGTKATIHVFPGAGHAFLNETNQRGFNKEQAEKAWKEIDAFLGHELLRTP